MSDPVKSPLTLADLRARRDEILRLAQQYGASNVRVFGSVARGQVGPDSDIDLLVTVRDQVSVFELVGLWLDLKDLLGCEAGLITEGIPDRRFLRRIMSDAVTL